MRHTEEESWRANLYFVIGLCGIDDPAFPDLAKALALAAHSPDAMPTDDEWKRLGPMLGDAMKRSGYVDRMNKWPLLQVIDGGKEDGA